MIQVSTTPRALYAIMPRQKWEGLFCNTVDDRNFLRGRFTVNLRPIHLSRLRRMWYCTYTTLLAHRLESFNSCPYNRERYFS